MLWGAQRDEVGTYYYVDQIYWSVLLSTDHRNYPTTIKIRSIL